MFKDKVKAVLSWLSLFAQAITTLVIVVVSSRKVHVKRALAKLSDKPIIIVGNGPSAKTDLPNVKSLRGLEDFSLCAVNNFAMSPEFEELRPELYVLADPNFWLAQVSADLAESRESLVDAMNYKVTWELILCLPFEAKGCSMVSDIVNDKISVSYFNRTPVSGLPRFCQILIKRQLGIYPAYNVLIPAIHIALWAKPSRLILIGADHSWHEEISMSESGHVLVEQKHFYVEKTSPKTVDKPSGEFSIGELFARWGCVFITYRYLNDLAVSEGVKIINCSSKSYIDAFERSSISDVFR